MRTAASLIGKGNAVQQLLKPPPLRQLAHYVVKRPLTIEHDIAGRQRRTPIWQAIRNRLQQKINAMRLLTTRRSQVQVLSPQPEKAPQSNGLRCFFPQAALCPPYVAEPSQEAGSSPCSRFFPERHRAAPGGPIPPFDKHTPLRYAEQRGLLRRRYPWRSTLFHTTGLVKEGSSCASAAFLRRRPRCWRHCCA